MTDGTTVFVVLMALCSVDLVLIWQISTLSDKVRDRRKPGRREDER